jgi:thioredoxin reductase (NADPH)
MELIDVVIIGSGPAGHTAALYTARANLNPLILEGHEPGGQLTTTTDVENFPGFPEGIQGPELMERMKKQAMRFGAKYEQTSVTSVDLTQRPFKVICENNTRYLAKSLIISSGASAKYLGLPNEKELIGRGVSACATCDGFFYRNKIVHVVGGGDTAMEEASFLAKFATKVFILHRRDTLRASKPMQDRVFKNPKIEVIWNTVVEEILFEQEKGVHALKVKNVVTEQVEQRPTDGFFLGIGHTPNTDFLKSQIHLDDKGFIKTTKGTTTNIDGVFACGDVMDPIYQQAITASGTGCQAAMDVEKFLEEHQDT